MTARTRRGLLLLAAVALVAGVAGGLLRAGIEPVGRLGGEFATRAALFHAALLIPGFFGTVISVERAVAVGAWYGFAVPALSGPGAMLLVAGFADAGAVVLVAAAVVFCVVNVTLVRRQPAAHTAMLLVAAVAGLVGNAAFAWDASPIVTIAWWFAFLVVTIAAERLELTRLARRRRGAREALFAVTAALFAGAAVSAIDPRIGGTLYGLALLATAAWLAVFDIARRTVRAVGVSRYMALCLLVGYGWLAVGGVAWVGMAQGVPLRDLAFHSVGLGFVVGMVMAHVPVILPAVARIGVNYGRAFYLPFAALNASMVVRAIGGEWRAIGAELNAAALVLFAIVVAFSVRRRPAVGTRGDAAHGGGDTGPD